MTELFLFFSTFGRAGGTSGLLGGELVAAKAHVNHVINSHGRHCAIVTWASWFGKMETHPDPFPTRPDITFWFCFILHCTHFTLRQQYYSVSNSNGHGPHIFINPFSL